MTCQKCGQRMVRASKPTGRFDPWEGGATEHQWSVCPEWRPRIIGGNGHDWRYEGENRIDGNDPHGRDPMKSENPPRPPIRAFPGPDAPSRPPLPSEPGE